jgi:DNA-binding PadR family transcriptional regulator
MHDQRDWNHNWRRWEAAARRGFRRFGNFNMNIGDGPGGAWGGFGNNFRIGRMLASGDLRLVALYLIEQQPRHGYDLIKAIEEKSAGFYSPSPGIVYPALTFLEEAGYVTSAPEANKKLYTITEEGRAHLNDNREAIESTLDFLGKAGEQMGQWREQMRGAGWPFGHAPHEEFGDDPASHRPPPPHDHGPHHPPHRPPHHDHPPHHDRDIEDVVPDVNDARKALKKAIKQAIEGGEDEQRRVADILHRAAHEIMHRPPHEDDIDL